MKVFTVLLFLLMILTEQASALEAGVGFGGCHSRNDEQSMCGDGVITHLFLMHDFSKRKNIFLGPTIGHFSHPEHGDFDRGYGERTGGFTYGELLRFSYTFGGEK